MTSLGVGASRVTLLRAGSYWWDGGAMFGVVPKPLWSRHHPPDEANRIEAAFNCFLIEHEGRRILVETGGGVRHDDRARERMRLPDSMPLHGFDPASIDIVLNTHLHWDHCGGNTTGPAGTALPAFPNARYLTQRGELEHARVQHPRDAVSYRAINYEPLLESGHLNLLDGDCEVMPGLAVRVVPGHNRNMMIVILRSGADTWCHMADLIPFAAQIRPTWVSAFDLFPLESIDNKLKILNEAAAGNWWCSFGHDPSIAFAKIEMREGQWQLHQSRT